jgi:putative phosphoesterase
VVLVAVVSDTHLPRGARRIPAECWARMAEADLILHAGDFVVRDVLDEIGSLGPRVVAVHGNMDGFGLRGVLPERTEVDVQGVRIGLVHDAGHAQGRLARMRRAFPAADAVVFGHSHIPLHEEAGGFQIFNPGSPTDRRRQPRHTMGMARVADGRVQFEHVVLD